MFEEANSNFDPNSFDQPKLKQTKIVAISDTHESWRQIKIPKCDLLIVAGDLTYNGDLRKIMEFNDWIAKLRDNGVIDEAVVIAGNHDLTAESDPETFEAHLHECIYLNETSYQYENLKIFGSPWTPWYHDWAFNAHRGDAIRKHWDLIPADTDIVVTHGPPFGVCDKLDDGRHVGCLDLRNKILELQPKLVICGHIHEGYGMGYIGNTLIMNAASLDGKYKVANSPLVMTL